METEQFFEKMDKLFVSELNHLDEPNPKLLVLFSGIPGSGKTLFAKHIEEKFKGIRFNGDDVRIFLRRLTSGYSVDWQEQFVDDYMYHVILNCTGENGLVVIDRSVDRSFPEVSAWASEHNFPWILIQLEADNKTIIDRLKQKGHDPSEKAPMGPEGYLENLPRWTEEHLEFIKSTKPDVVINNNASPQFESVDKLIEQRLMQNPKG